MASMTLLPCCYTASSPSVAAAPASAFSLASPGERLVHPCGEPSHSFTADRRLVLEFAAAAAASWPGRRRRLSSHRVFVYAAATTQTPAAPANLESEPHKYFDQVTIIVRSGDGGDGAILSMPRPTAPGAGDKKKDKDDKKKKKNAGQLRRRSDGSIVLPMGGQGGDVVIAADETIDSLLPFHKQRRYNARRGSNVDAMGPLTPFLTDGSSAPTLKISVPVGTVVKQKKGNKLLADLARPGDKLLVGHGGRGGISMLEMQNNNRRLRKIDAPVVNDPKDKTLTKGIPGEEFVLELTLRVVADVGLVGLPNAGKSSLLAAVSQARPDIAAYPFTTLMPNLGRIQGDPYQDDGGFAAGPTVADLPGLIKDAHLGKGLGRMFLRHLRRTRLILHVVDASTENPVDDYKTLREELRMYNPAYLERPHIIVLNKLDLLEGKESLEAIKKQVLEIGQADLKTNSSSETESIASFPRAVAVVGISALKREGIEYLLKQVRSTLQNMKPSEKPIAEESKQFYAKAQWHL